MKTLEEFIASRTKTGDLTHFSLFPCSSGWQANVAGTKHSNGYSVGIDKDAVNACRKAFLQKEPNSKAAQRRDEDLI